MKEDSDVSQRTDGWEIFLTESLLKQGREIYVYWDIQCETANRPSLHKTWLFHNKKTYYFSMFWGGFFLTILLLKKILDIFIKSSGVFHSLKIF